MLTLTVFFLGFLSLVSGQCPGSCQTPPFPFVSSTVSASLISDLQFYFPESQSPPAAFISDSFAVPRINFISSGTISCTFMWEGAGYRNQMGVFTMSVGTNGAVTVLTETIIFPDCQNSPTPVCVTPGDTVTLGPYPAGTILGFFIIPNGACTTSCSTSSGQGCKFYSESSLNSADSNLRHVAVFADPGSEKIFIGFEDLKIAASDRDYNDVVFTFNAPSSVVSYDGLPWACLPRCQNSKPCDFVSGQCQCGVYAPPTCVGCGCNDFDSCTTDTCDYANNRCIFTPNCATTAIQTTGEQTTRQQTTQYWFTTDRQTTAIQTTSRQTTAVQSTSQQTTAIQTTEVQTTVQPVATTDVVSQTGNTQGTGSPATGSEVTGNNQVTDSSQVTANNAVTGNTAVNTSSSSASGDRVLSSGTKIEFSVAILLAFVIVLFL